VFTGRLLSYLFFLIYNRNITICLGGERVSVNCNVLNNLIRSEISTAGLQALSWTCAWHTVHFWMLSNRPVWQLNFYSISGKPHCGLWCPGFKDCGKYYRDTFLPKVSISHNKTGGWADCPSIFNADSKGILKKVAPEVSPVFYLYFLFLAKL